jgi:GMP synthase-like glutamine amidotransferase
MVKKEKLTLKVAILDLYDGVENEGMGGFTEILNRYKANNQLDLTVNVFDVRKKTEMPGLDYDVYISSGGPGSPLDSEGTEWEKKYFNLVDKLEDFNLSNHTQKKYGFFVCHSFQLLCRKYKLGEINMRRSASFGVLPVHKTSEANNEPVFAGLDDPFLALDSRLWQVVNPDIKKFEELGMKLMAVEKERPHIDLPRALMAIRLNDYFFTTQFHPEANPTAIKGLLLKEEKKKEVVFEHGIDKYNEMVARIDDVDKIMLTQQTIIPNFLDQAVLSLHEA